MQLQGFIQRCYRGLWPHTCALCKKTSRQAIDLCAPCQNSLPRILSSCSRCGNPIETNASLCGYCIRKPPPFDHTLSPYHYQDAIVHMITRLKFQHQLAYARILGTLLGYQLKPITKPHCIIPMPLHRKRLQERGFNQALEIARPLANMLDIPIDVTHCQRIKHTPAQSSLPAKARKHNMKNAFAVRTDFRAKHVAILDDVITTGHTVTELAKMLKKQGVQRIDVWCCARTSRETE